MKTTSRWPRAALLALALASASRSQAPLTGPSLGPSLAVAHGYRAELVLQETSGPATLSGFAVADDGLYAALGNLVVHYDGTGNSRLAHALGVGHTIGLITVPAAGDPLWFTDFQADRLWRLDRATGAATSTAMVHNAFDLARAPDGTLLASANPTWPAPGAAAGLWLIDPVGGQHREIARLSGASGPLVFDRSGNLLYAVLSARYPPPAGSVSIVRFAAHDVKRAQGGGPPLQLSDAIVVATGLDGAYDLAFDDRDRLYVSDPLRGGVSRTAPGSFAFDEPLVVASSPPLATLQMQFVGDHPATFDAMQPAADELYVHTSDWTFTGEVFAIETRRPELTSTPRDVAPPGPVTFALTGAPPRALATLCLSAVPLRGESVVLDLAGTPLWFALDVALPFVCVPATADSNGSAQWPLRHPGGGFANATVHAQAIALAPALPLRAGTSTALTLTLTP